MNKINFKIALLLAPLAYTIHHFEEHIIFNFRAWRLKYFLDNNQLSTETVFLILTGITLINIILHFIIENKATTYSMIIFLMSTQVANFLFHLVFTIIFWDFSPGLITAILLYLPVNIFIIQKGLQEKLLTFKTTIILFVIGTSMFVIFEMLGPAIILLFLIITYIWVAYSAFAKKSVTT